MFGTTAHPGQCGIQAEGSPRRIRSVFSHGLGRETTGFTLIELLVVIAIISLLVSILIPSLKRAKELTRRVVCASNLHEMGVALMTYAADHRGEFPEGGRSGTVASFADFYGRGWKNSIYPKYIQVPEMCYCPSNPEIQPDGYVAADPWGYWDYLSYAYCIIGYAYTPNQQTVQEDNQDNRLPQNAEEAVSTGVLMADSNLYLDGDWDVQYQWNHLLEDPQGGSWMGGDGHVQWRKYNQQQIRFDTDTPWGLYERWW